MLVYPVGLLFCCGYGLYKPLRHTTYFVFEVDVFDLTFTQNLKLVQQVGTNLSTYFLKREIDLLAKFRLKTFSHYDVI